MLPAACHGAVSRSVWAPWGNRKADILAALPRNGLAAVVVVVGLEALMHEAAAILVHLFTNIAGFALATAA